MKKKLAKILNLLACKLDGRYHVAKLTDELRIHEKKYDVVRLTAQSSVAYLSDEQLRVSLVQSILPQICEHFTVITSGYYDGTVTSTGILEILERKH